MSRPPALAVLGYSGAAMFLRRVPASDIAGVISIHGHREFGVEAGVACRLDLTFDDVEVAPPGDVQAIERVMARKRWAEQNGLFEVAPTPEDVAAIIRFAEIVRGTSGTLLCHCGGGMSRAPAASLICLATWRGPGAERECVGEVLGLRRGAIPHAGMIRFADELLGRNGRLVRALAEVRPDVK
jgi:predicted protein tyrosine phosphatase